MKAELLRIEATVIRASLLCLISVFLCVEAVPGATYFVAPDGSGNYPTIQDAVNAAQDGDVIELGDGVFMHSGNRHLDYLGLAITIRSQSGDPQCCTIDCQADSLHPYIGADFSTEEGPLSRLEGVTIRNGYAGGSG